MIGDSTLRRSNRRVLWSVKNGKRYQRTAVSAVARCARGRYSGGSQDRAHLSHAAVLLATFAAVDEGVNKLDAIRGMLELTVEEFNAEVKKAQELADTEDKANGFVSVEKTKILTERYGKRRLCINTRTSEMRQLFGAFKHGYKADEQPYGAALIGAREYLKDHGIKWDGAKIPTDTEKAQATERNAKLAALGEVMKGHPQQEGESFGDYTKRLEGEIEIQQVAAKEKILTESFQKEWDIFLKKFGESRIINASIGLMKNVGDNDSIKGVIDYLNEELTLRG